MIDLFIITPVRKSRSRKYTYFRCIYVSGETPHAANVSEHLAEIVYGNRENVYARYDSGCDALCVRDDEAYAVITHLCDEYDPRADIQFLEPKEE